MKVFCPAHEWTCPQMQKLSCLCVIARRTAVLPMLLPELVVSTAPFGGEWDIKIPVAGQVLNRAAASRSVKS
jgi:hypothetical protein